MLRSLFLISVCVLLVSCVSSKLTLRYFGTRGRAELPRLVLEEAGLQYDQVHYGADWPTEKAEGLKSGVIPFGQLPVLSWGDQHIPQSMAIVRYVGRLHGMYPSDPRQALKVEIVLGLYDDIRTRYGRLVYNAEFANMRQKFVDEDIPPWIAHASRLLGEHDYFANNEFSVGDLAIFDSFNAVLAVDSKLLDSHINLKKWHQRISLRPQIQAYLRSERRPRFQNGKSAFFDNEANPGHPVHADL